MNEKQIQCYIIFTIFGLSKLFITYRRFLLKGGNKKWQMVWCIRLLTGHNTWSDVVQPYSLMKVDINYPLFPAKQESLDNITFSDIARMFYIWHPLPKRTFIFFFWYFLPCACLRQSIVVWQFCWNGIFLFCLAFVSWYVCILPFYRSWRLHVDCELFI